MVTADGKLRILPVALSDLTPPGDSVKVANTGDVCTGAVGSFLGGRGREGDTVVAGGGAGETDWP